TRSRLCDPAVLHGAEAGESAKAAGFEPARVALEADASYVSDGFQAASSAPFKVAGSTLRATLLTLAYAADKHGEKPWMDTTLNADARAALLLKAMTEDEK
ncbi:glycosyl hydrolase, partial [Stenotrophomonas sp. SG1]|nr:glycosyl hydrolase [Stenotrophomonas sp. SG1]